ncbi:MAG: hypothetical protein ABI406_03970 [Ktedonobacteraceae bacterium]
MVKPVTWREVLGQIIEDAHERQRIASALGINPITLERWANHTSKPRIQNLRLLLAVLPEQHHDMIASLSAEFPDILTGMERDVIGDSAQEIPSEFYTHAINAYVQTPRAQRFWLMSTTIMQQALGQLGSRDTGIAITVVQCVSPLQAQTVRSLRLRIGRATPPWQTNLEQNPIFLGAESMAGFAVMHQRPLIIENREEDNSIYPAHWIEWEESAAAYPITHSGMIAGSLLVSSTRSHYFVPFRRTLIQNYARLMTLAFEPEDFYPPEQVDLRLMPHYSLQEKYLLQFRQRVSEVMLQAARNHLPIDLFQAQDRVWRQLEDELLQLPSYMEK